MLYTATSTSPTSKLLTLPGARSAAAQTGTGFSAMTCPNTIGSSAPTEASGMSARCYIIDDREKKTFLLDREGLVSEDILRKEMAQIFGHCWIYVGHAS